MMKASPTASFVVPQTEFLLPFLIVAFHVQRCLAKSTRAASAGTVDSQYRSLLLATRRTNSEGGETRPRILFYPLPPRHLRPNAGRQGPSVLFDRNGFMFRIALP
jgi:hypothetical protein